MNVANLQLEGLYLAVASVHAALVKKGLLSSQEVDDALRAAEEAVLGDPRSIRELSAAHREAIVFPARLLRLANNGSSDGAIQSFSELAKMIGTLTDPEGPDPGANRADKSELFYASENGDEWFLVTKPDGKTLFDTFQISDREVSPPSPSLKRSASANHTARRMRSWTVCSKGAVIGPQGVDKTVWQFAGHRG